MSDTDQDLHQELLAEIQRLNQQLGLYFPNNIKSNEEKSQWEELFAIIRQDYAQDTLDIEQVPAVLNQFLNLAFNAREVYLQEYGDRVLLGGKSGLPEDEITIEEYEKRLDEIAQTVPPQLRDLFYYIHYSEQIGSQLDPEIEAIWKDIQKNGISDYIQQQKLADALDRTKRSSLDARRFSLPKPGFNKPITSQHIEDILKSGDE